MHNDDGNAPGIQDKKIIFIVILKYPAPFLQSERIAKMVLGELQEKAAKLSRPEKFCLVQFLISELEKEEQELSRHFSKDIQHALWSQHNAFAAARNLQTLLEKDA